MASSKWLSKQKARDFLMQLPSAVLSLSLCVCVRAPVCLFLLCSEICEIQLLKQRSFDEKHLSVSASFALSLLHSTSQGSHFQLTQCDGFVKIQVLVSQQGLRHKFSRNKSSLDCAELPLSFSEWEVQKYFNGRDPFSWAGVSIL